MYGVFTASSQQRRGFGEEHATEIVGWKTNLERDLESGSGLPRSRSACRSAIGERAFSKK